MSTGVHHEWESELESEFEGELEGEFESEFEGEWEGELEGEMEGEFEEEYEGEFEGELEGEEFFRRLRGIARRAGGFVRRAAPILRQVARVAAPIVGTAVGGPFGTILGGLASRALGDSEFEGEFEEEYEGELEGPAGPTGAAVASQDPTAAILANLAARAQREDEAEAMIGASTSVLLSRADRRALRRVLPHMVRGTAILTRILRRRRLAPAVRVVPTIVQRAATTLTRQAASTGRPVTPRAAARAMATQTRRVLSSPRTCVHAIQGNIRAAARGSRTMRPTGMPRLATGR